VAIAYGAIQFLENHLLIPLLMKGGVNLPPALTVVSQALMAMLFGFLGLMVAVPLLAAIMVPVKMLYVEGVVGDDMEVLPEEEQEAKKEARAGAA
jgi:predicted PurR-regulated permease PerM